MNQDIDENPIRWGVLATGAISRQFADALAILPDAELIAVGSRNIDSAKNFAENYNVPYAYESYEQVVNDPKVDVVYIVGEKGSIRIHKPFWRPSALTLKTEDGEGSY